MGLRDKVDTRLWTCKGMVSIRFGQMLGLMDMVVTRLWLGKGGVSIRLGQENLQHNRNDNYTASIFSPSN